MIYIISKALMFLAALLAVMSFGGVLNKYLLKVIFPTGKEKFFLKNEKLSGDVTRAVIFLDLYASQKFSHLWLLALPVLITIKILYYHLLWKKWMRLEYFYAGFIVDLAISAVSCYFFLAF